MAVELFGVTGVTGAVGGRVARSLVSAGLRVRMVVRDRSSAPDIGAEVAPGSRSPSCDRACTWTTCHSWPAPTALSPARPARAALRRPPGDDPARVLDRYPGSYAHLLP